MRRQLKLRGGSNIRAKRRDKSLLSIQQERVEATASGVQRQEVMILVQGCRTETKTARSAFLPGVRGPPTLSRRPHLISSILIPEGNQVNQRHPNDFLPLVPLV